ncbi:MAG TPA: DUF4258 domain-containing protein [Desulfobacterales bacterium]|nr:MAG: hypothetical protein DRI57_00800 [Deltaproteobacteria bacterium]HHC24394.1 DUF4258 domain-containing protein [Desulfobacterales bacterium]
MSHHVSDKVVFTTHAKQRMRERKIPSHTVFQVMQSDRGHISRDSRVVHIIDPDHSIRSTRGIHVVTGQRGNFTVVITVYRKPGSVRKPMENQIKTSLQTSSF